MLTFEEFFNKKKISLAALQVAEPGLFVEFSEHYPLMGEKSFDHTKKYWFNKLRRAYPLAVKAKSHPVEAAAISDMAIQGIAAAAAQNLDEHLAQPKFKEDHLAELVAENVAVKEVSLAEEEKEILGEKNEEKESEEQNAELKTEPVKPAFKPRFNPKNIPKVGAEKSEEKESEERNAEPITENSEPKTEPAKPAFKPRFNPKNIPKVDVEKSEEKESGERNAEPVNDNSELNVENQSLTEPENKEAKPVYKPRFQMKNMSKPALEKPNSESDNPELTTD